MSGVDPTEQTLQSLCDDGDYDAALTLGIKRYGPEILGFLSALQGDRERAREIFAVVAERLWTGLPTFAWTSSFRTWAFAVARNTSHDFHRRARAAPVAVPLSVCTALSELEQADRTATAEYERTETKDRFAEIRRSLSQEDQELLILRVDKELSWADLARVLANEPTLDGKELVREAARLRKRFQALKERLHELARREGLVPPRDTG